MSIIQLRRPFAKRAGDLTKYENFDFAREIATQAKQVEQTCLNYTRVAQNTKRVAKEIHLLVQQIVKEPSATKRTILENKTNALITTKLNPLLERGKELFDELNKLPMQEKCPNITVGFQLN